MAQATPSKISLQKVLPYIFVVAGILGVLASFALTYDKLHVLADSSYDPSCNINPILSCGSVMKTEQASLFGMPNTIFGIMAFSMLLTTGLLLLGGATVKRWMWLGLQVGATVGVIFMHYLYFQSVFRINAICPWCFMVWMITIPTFWYLTVYNLQTKNLPVPVKLLGASRYIQKHHGDLLIVWYAVLLGVLVQQFWYYWSTIL